MFFKSFDGKHIYLHEWNDVKVPVGIVQIIHGMTEHAGRYKTFAKYLNENGYLVIADDHRGHGQTDKENLGYSNGNMFKDTLKDEILLTRYYQNKYPGLPYFILGFSYGSFLTQAYIAEYGSHIDGAIIAGSNYQKDFSVYLGEIVANLGNEKKPAKFIEKMSFGSWEKKFKGNGTWLSSDNENNQLYKDDPLSGFTCSNRFYRDFFKGVKELYTEDYINKLPKSLPLLLVSGENDPVGKFGKGVKKLYRFYKEIAGMKHVNIVLFKDSRHEFLNEKKNRDLKWRTILDFIERNSEN